jgi:hypothetical protein
MGDHTPLPSRAKLLELLERLLPENEDMDAVSASIILDRQGVDRVWLANALRSRLEHRIVDMRAKGEDVPPALSEVVSDLERNTKTEEEAASDPERWIDMLLSGQYPESESGPSKYVQAFRPRQTEPLTEEDIQILKDLEAELEARAKEHE